MIRTTATLALLLACTPVRAGDYDSLDRVAVTAALFEATKQIGQNLAALPLVDRPAWQRETTVRRLCLGALADAAAPGAMRASCRAYVDLAERLCVIDELCPNPPRPR